QPTLRPPGDLAQLDDLALVRLQRSDNDWLARQSRRVLADRVAAGVRVEAAQTEAQRMLVGPAQPVHRLRALWTLHLTAGLGDGQLAALLDDRDEHIRIWAIRLLTDDRASVPPTAIIERLVRLASTEPSALVRLALASALQRLPDEARAQLASPLLARGEDASDHNIPLMLWYGIEPLVRAQVPAFSFEVMLAHAKMPRVQKLGARRIAEDIDTAPDRVDALLTAIAEVDGLENRQAVLDGLAQSLSGRRNTPKPTHWDELLPRLARRANAALHTRIRDLSAMFGDPKALAEIRDFALNSTADIIERRLALEVLVATRGPGLREVCLQLIKTRRLASTAAAGLATFSDPMIAGVILAVWPELDPLERASILAALVSRLPWSAQVLDALEAGTLRKSDISVAQVRQMRAYQDPVLTPRLVRHWGPARDESEKDRTGLIAAWTARFAPEKLAGANVSHGRVVFRNLCGACHTLNSEGGTLGPDLTGGARDNLNYLLENILFPSALVPDDYRLTTLTLKDGRALVGMIRERSGSTLKLKTMTDLISLSRADVAKEETSAASLMPPGLLDSLSGEEARDLITYLMSKSALPK
ncbi:MAG: c-type cytochrome, partial [Undibacterium sp.]|nr:c-type cytochrome [Opitutaceae bacterium]